MSLWNRRCKRFSKFNFKLSSIISNQFSEISFLRQAYPYLRLQFHILPSDPCSSFVVFTQVSWCVRAFWALHVQLPPARLRCEPLSGSWCYRAQPQWLIHFLVRKCSSLNGCCWRCLWGPLATGTPAYGGMPASAGSAFTFSRLFNSRILTLISLCINLLYDCNWYSKRSKILSYI